MTIESAVYVLKPILDDPRFRGFVWPDAPSLLGNDELFDDFGVENSEYLTWKPNSLMSVWKPLKVSGPVNAFNDYPCLELATPVFSRRAVEALGEMLKANGELLPLVSAVGEYFAYINLTKLDVLDVDKSHIRRIAPDRTAVAIRRFVFKKRRLAGATIFRLPEHPDLYLVTETFKKRVEASCLNGFHFIKVWPIPKGSDWKIEDAIRHQKSKRKLVGEALILRFRLKKDKPTPSEKNNAKTIEQSLRSKLSLSSLDDKYWGSIEVTEFENGEYRVFCTCPDCEALAEHLRDSFEQVPWDYDFDIVKRFGNLYDAKAKEKRQSVKKLSE